MNKKTVAILFGGASSEHDVSTVSAKGIISNINKEKYNLVLLGITKNGEWFLFDDDINMLPNDNWLTSKSLKRAFISPDTSVHGIVTENGEKIFVDAVFPCFTAKTERTELFRGFCSLLRFRLSAVMQHHQAFVWIRELQMQCLTL